MAMNGVSFLLGVFFLISSGEGRQNTSNVELDNLANIISLTEENIDEEIANKHHLVLFYEAGCDECNLLSSVWYGLAKEFNRNEDSEIAIAKINCSTETELCSRCSFQHVKVRDQVTRCQSCEYSGMKFTCTMPTVSYGSSYGGVPVATPGNQYDYLQWCKEMGFGGPASITTSYESVRGALNWCKGYDDYRYKWCDREDGYWKDETLSRKMMGERIQALECTVVENDRCGHCYPADANDGPCKPYMDYFNNKMCVDAAENEYCHTSPDSSIKCPSKDMFEEATNRFCERDDNNETFSELGAAQASCLADDSCEGLSDLCGKGTSFKLCNTLDWHHSGCGGIVHQRVYDCYKNDQCINGGTCVQVEPDSLYGHNYCSCSQAFYGNRCQYRLPPNFTNSTTPRPVSFQMQYGFPTLMLVRAGGNDTTTYLGPINLAALVGFVNEEKNRAPSPPSPEKGRSDLLVEAGCKKQEWAYRGVVPSRYHWIPTGNLLAAGVCIGNDYKKYFPPEDGHTKVYCTIKNPEVREVDVGRIRKCLLSWWVLKCDTQNEHYLKSDASLDIFSACKS